MEHCHRVVFSAGSLKTANCMLYRLSFSHSVYMIRIGVTLPRSSCFLVSSKGLSMTGGVHASSCALLASTSHSMLLTNTRSSSKQAAIPTRNPNNNPLSPSDTLKANITPRGKATR